MRALFYFFILTLTVQIAHAAEFAVVVAGTNKVENLSAERIKDVFLKKRRFANGTRLIPINVLGNQLTRLKFEERVLMMSRDELSQYWTTSHFQGITPPATQASFASMKLFVEKVEGAIGYLPLEMVGDDLKVIHEF